MFTQAQIEGELELLREIQHYDEFKQLTSYDEELAERYAKLDTHLLVQALEQMLGKRPDYITELQEANNRELLRRREAEAEVERLRRLVNVS